MRDHATADHAAHKVETGRLSAEGSGCSGHFMAPVSRSMTPDSDNKAETGIASSRNHAMGDSTEFAGNSASGIASEQEQPVAPENAEKTDALYGAGVSPQAGLTDARFFRAAGSDTTGVAESKQFSTASASTAEDSSARRDHLTFRTAGSEKSGIEGMNSATIESEDTPVAVFEEQSAHQEGENDGINRSSEDLLKNASGTDGRYGGMETAGAVRQNVNAETATGAVARDYAGAYRLEAGSAQTPNPGDRSAVNANTVPGIHADRPAQETGPIVTRNADVNIKERPQAGEPPAGQSKPGAHDAADAGDAQSDSSRPRDGSPAVPLSRGMADNAGTGA
ncbi:MAG TPA: hypothetical protein VLL97_13230, partial [Acidobacteriota bacterium]|nr:hypothetical protein [Acidobacteriota bacterium]